VDEFFERLIAAAAARSAAAAKAAAARSAPAGTGTARPAPPAGRQGRQVAPPAAPAPAAGYTAAPPTPVQPAFGGLPGDGDLLVGASLGPGTFAAAPAPSAAALLSAFGSASSLLAGIVLAEALAPPIAQRPHRTER